MNLLQFSELFNHSSIILQTTVGFVVDIICYKNIYCRAGPQIILQDKY